MSIRWKSLSKTISSTVSLADTALAKIEKYFSLEYVDSHEMKCGIRLENLTVAR